ncbi:helix-turn-helix transcriptional regulator [Umezawaea sp. NPDC059074]|uniref:helix-turn-helix transcriptional regulator n=1 Tax=Umezawaea sp. NPDC059074 TaxID=3346716 RepID=UPI0036786B91
MSTETASHPLRGRSTELGTALRALRAGTLVVVRGEPGIGKTAFVREVVEQARRQGRAVGTSTARPGDDVTPLASLGPALRSGPDPALTSTDFLALAPLTAQPLWLAEHLAALLERRAERDPLLLVLDDAQWADPLSTFALRVLVPRLAASPITWLLATREVDNGPVDHVLANTDHATCIALPPLSDSAASEIAKDHLGHRADQDLTRRLHSAAGIPFLLVQLLTGILDPTAGSLSDGIRRRTATTSDDCRALLRTGAVLGTAFTLTDAAELLDRPPTTLTDPLREAIRAGLLTDNGTTVTFRHDLLRQAVYDDIPPSARAAVHRTFVDHLLTTGRGHAEAAPHILATATPGDTKAVDVLRRAAHEILGTMAITSMHLIREAFALLDQDDPLWGEVGQDVISILVTARHHQDAATFSHHLLAGPLTPDQQATVHLLLAPWRFATNQHETLTTTPDPRTSPPLHTRLQAFRAAALGTPTTEIPDDPVAAAITYAAAARQADHNDDHRTAVELYTKALTQATSAEHDLGCPSPMFLGLRRAVALSHLDDFQTAREWLDQASTTDSWQSARLAWLRAHLNLGEGNITEARTAAKDAVRLMDDLLDHALHNEVHHILVTTALLQGDLPAARTHLATAEHHNGHNPLLRALIDTSESLVDLVENTEIPWKADFLLQAFPAPTAAKALATLATRTPGVPSLDGAAALAAGDHTKALKLLQASPRPLLLARAEEEHGKALLDSDRPTAITFLDQSRDRYAALEATAPAARVQRILHATGARRRRWSPTPKRPETGWDALTTTERRIALLVAAGHTNRSAAEELVVSPSTVGTHLRAVFTKLEINSRVQLTRLVLQRETPPTP